MGYEREEAATFQQITCIQQHWMQLKEKGTVDMKVKLL
jgi:hypothetical protein